MRAARRLAAVLAAIYDGPEGPTLLLIRRSMTTNHPGQVGFPGGRPEPEDSGLRDTALREAREELGIDPADVTIVGALPVVETTVSNFAIHPFVGRLRARPAVRMQVGEVAAVLDVPLAALMVPGLPIEEVWELPAPNERGAANPASVTGAGLPGSPAGLIRRRVRYFPWGEDKIWGATGHIIENLLVALSSGAIVI